jgi:hypothetical protein
MNGFTVSENALGATVVRLHYSADEDKNPLTDKGAKWYEQMRRLYPDENKWAQEFEISWFVAQGARVYPEFTETLHCRPLELRRRKVILRAWDFGYLAPACLIAQIDERDRLCILREIIGHEETTKQFAEKVIARCADWYPLHQPGYQDYCDPAGQQRKSTAEQSETQDVEVLKNLGIYPQWKHGWTRKHGRALVHQLLVLRSDNTPGLYIDGEKCPILMQGFLGKYVFPPRKGGQVSDEPEEDNHPWADAHAALRYLVTNQYNALGLKLDQRPPVPERKVDFHGYGTKLPRGRESKI